MPELSVIIATRNEEKHIARIIRSLQQQSYRNFEIIIVDNNSRDKTIDIAKKFDVRIIRLKDTDFPKGTKNYRGYQVNKGVKQSMGSIIFFPDADMTFDKGLLTEIYKLSKKYDALYIPETIIGRGWFGKVRNFERSFYDQTPIDAIRAVKRDTFLRAGGYDEKNIVFGPDDWDLTRSIKHISHKIGITNTRLYHHEELMTLNDFIEKKSKYSGTFSGYIKKWGKDDQDLRRQLGITYRAVGVFIENGKWKKIVANPHLFIATGLIRLVTLINYKSKKFL